MRGGAVVADVRHQRGHQHQRAAPAARCVRAGVRPRCPSTQWRAKLSIASASRRRLSSTSQRDQRLVDVELELPLAGRDADRHVVPHHLGAHHGQRLDLRRVDLARHDRAARLVLRQLQFAQPGARAAAHQADVVGDLGQRDGQHAAARRAGRPAPRGRPSRRTGWRPRRRARPAARPAPQRPRGAELGVRVQPGAHGRAADGQRVHRRQRLAQRGFGAARAARRSRRTPGPASPAWRPAGGCGRS